ncbi:hypothetical protein Trco_007955 [Trichoderma cornu-damae]|uniref:Uncharacterized protein n=1 Tax=Trichoderma cornu-damae TaxID=654480 RepID=A0A9P8QHZ7_9HYPO|nr:hypothetical protein Trco_007955 [Trichoderma cornu-damae]
MIGRIRIDVTYASVFMLEVTNNRLGVSRDKHLCIELCLLLAVTLSTMQDKIRRLPQCRLRRQAPDGIVVGERSISVAGSVQNNHELGIRNHSNQAVGHQNHSAAQVLALEKSAGCGQAASTNPR